MTQHEREVIRRALDAPNNSELFGEFIYAPTAEKAAAYQNMVAKTVKLAQCSRCGKINPADIHTCSPQVLKEKA